MAARAAARATPRFGSVSVAGQAGTVASVTDVAAIRQADGSIDLVVRRAGGAPTTLNTERDAVLSQPEISRTGRTAESGALLQVDATRLILDPAPIDSTDGTLAGRVRLVHPDYTFTAQPGRWGSRLSNTDDSAGAPRLLAGTHAGGGTTAGGSEAAYIGAHYGTTGARFQ